MTRVVVVGSGGAGLIAALAAAVGGASVIVLEKAELLGGTTALSGAAFWIPGNPLQEAAGIEDSVEAGRLHLESLGAELVVSELVGALVETGPELVRFVEENTALRFVLCEGFPDYHATTAGGLPGGGRSLSLGLFSFAESPEWRDRIAGEPERLLLAERPLSSGRIGAVDPGLVADRADADLEGLGRALIGGLLKACSERGVVVRTSVRAERLVSEGGTVRGVRVRSAGGVEEIAADAVVLATGGFERAGDLVRDFLRGPVLGAVGAPTNTGDGLRMAMRVGAGLGNMREAWWSPAIRVPGTRRDGGDNLIQSTRERAMPGSIIVNRAGRRFADDAVNYNAFGAALHQIDTVRLERPNIPAFLVFSQSAVDEFGVLGGAPGHPVPDWVRRAETIPALAGILGVDREQLVETVDRFNDHARAGVDPEFGRGDSAYERFIGAARLAHPDSPLATLGPLERSPFYAIELIPSVLGTKGGPRTDQNGAVLDVDGEVIPGLYAAGDVVASPMGMSYAGAGAALAAAGVWGLRAGRAAALGSDYSTPGL